MMKATYPPAGFEPKFLAAALELTKSSTTRTSPNPRVGCVIVKDGVIIGEGVTRVPGEAHAEVVALKAAGERAQGADMYVTLEPCCHFGRTPPCTDAILAAKIGRVFVGSIDPNPLVCGAGIELLNAGGIVTHLIGDADCGAALEPFRKFIQKKQPWIHLKVASTLDGFLATQSGSSKWITGDRARQMAHRLRAQVDGIIVGIGTVLADDPRLDVRGVEGSDPVAIVLDGRLRIEATHRCVRRGTLVFHGPLFDHVKRSQLTQEYGVKCIEIEESSSGRLNLNAVLDALHDLQMVQVMVEGGGEVLTSFLEERLGDELTAFYAPKLFGGGRSWSGRILTDDAQNAICLTDVSVSSLGPDMSINGRLCYRSEENETCSQD